MAGNLASETAPGGDAEADTTGGSAAELTVAVHLRASPSSVGARRQQAVLERARTLEADGQVPSLTVERWGSRVTVPPADGDDAAAVDLYEEFSRAVERVGGRLEPFFEDREAVGGLLSSGPPAEQVIVLPVVCLAVRREGEVRGLYPCWKDGHHYSVEEGLSALASDAGAENLADDPAP